MSLESTRKPRIRSVKPVRRVCGKVPALYDNKYKMSAAGSYRGSVYERLAAA